MKLKSLIIMVLCGSVLGTLHAQNERMEDRTDAFVRIIKNDDGSSSRYESKRGETKGLVKETTDPNGIVISRTQYLCGKYGQLVSCKVYDGKGNEMYKVRYGYDKNTANLREERMFDSRQTDPKTGQNIIVRRFIYSYDEQGNRSKPVSIVYTKGVKIEDRHKFATPTAPDQSVMKELNMTPSSSENKK